MEPFAGELVAAALREQGVTVLLDTATTRVTRDGDGRAVETGDGDPVTAEEVLVATGRTPRTRDIGLETIGLTPGDWLADRRHHAGRRASTGSTPSAT